MWCWYRMLNSACEKCTMYQIPKINLIVKCCKNLLVSACDTQYLTKTLKELLIEGYSQCYIVQHLKTTSHLRPPQMVLHDTYIQNNLRSTTSELRPYIGSPIWTILIVRFHWTCLNSLAILKAYMFREYTSYLVVFFPQLIEFLCVILFLLFPAGFHPPHLDGMYILAHLQPLPLGRDETALVLRSIGDRMNHLLASEEINCRLQP